MPPFESTFLSDCERLRRQIILALGGDSRWDARVDAAAEDGTAGCHGWDLQSRPCSSHAGAAANADPEADRVLAAQVGSPYSFCDGRRSSPPPPWSPLWPTGSEELRPELSAQGTGSCALSLSSDASLVRVTTRERKAACQTSVQALLGLVDRTRKCLPFEGNSALVFHLHLHTPAVCEGKRSERSRTLCDG